jgi:hypothetical protein
MVISPDRDNEAFTKWQHQVIVVVCLRATSSAMFWIEIAPLSFFIFIAVNIENLKVKLLKESLA